MHRSADSISQIIQRLAPTDGLHPSPVPGVDCIKISTSDERTKRHWRASVYMVIQGTKEVLLGKTVYTCDDAHYAVTPIDLPVTSRAVGAMATKPFLCLRIGFESPLLREAIANIPRDASPPALPIARALVIGEMTPSLHDATRRLSQLFCAPTDAAALGPLVVQEIFHYVLSGPDGASIRQFLRGGTAMHKIAHIVHRIKGSLHKEMNIGDLAQAAGMSRSAFFQHFKQITALSPLQYQKRLRLLEARHLLSKQNATAEQSAFQVGYQSASQFSREYSRMFGHSPRADASIIKRTGRAPASM